MHAYIHRIFRKTTGKYVANVEWSHLWLSSIVSYHNSILPLMSKTFGFISARKGRPFQIQSFWSHVPSWHPRWPVGQFEWNNTCQTTHFPWEVSYSNINELIHHLAHETCGDSGWRLNVNNIVTWIKLPYPLKVRNWVHSMRSPWLSIPKMNVSRWTYRKQSKSASQNGSIYTFKHCALKPSIITSQWYLEPLSSLTAPDLQAALPNATVDLLQMLSKQTLQLFVSSITFPSCPLVIRHIWWCVSFIWTDVILNQETESSNQPRLNN